MTTDLQPTAWDQRRQRLSLIERPRLPGLELDTTGVTVTGRITDITATGITNLFQGFDRFDRCRNWWAGDLYLAVETQDGTAAANVAFAHLLHGPDSGHWMTQVMLERCIKVAYAVAPERRRETLSWSHHEAVHRLQPDDQTRWLDAAEAGGLGVRGLVAAIEAEAAAGQEQLDLPDPVHIPALPRALFASILERNPHPIVVWDTSDGELFAITEAELLGLKRGRASDA